MKKKNPIKRILKVLCTIIGVLLIIVIVFFGVLTVTEYKPDAIESVTVREDKDETTKTFANGDTFSIMTWNVGYAGLDETADFFMDGGTHVRTATKDMVLDNLNAVSTKINEKQPDFVFLQEVDTGSDRTYHINEVDTIARTVSDFPYNSDAFNYKCLFVPIPVPPMGKITSGIMTLSSGEVTEAYRVQLPIPFKYPVRIANIKRCLLVNRIPIEGSDKELVLVNLHLEAYDSGEGKIAQTRQLRELLDEEVAKGNYVIAGGDFNQSFSNVDISGYPIVAEGLWEPGIIDVNDFGNGYQFVTDNTTPTCRSLDKPIKDADRDPSVFQYYVIDGFIVSDNLTVNTAETLDLGFAHSDHNPVLMSVTID